MLFGGHCSGGVKKALDNAQAIGADCVQLFVQSPRAWRFPQHDPADLARFRSRREETGQRAVVVHALYLVNLASPADDLYAKSVATMRDTVDAACAIGADAVVFHVGSHLGTGFEAGLERVVPALEQVLERCAGDTWLCLENSAGAGGTIGRSVEELAVLVERLGRHPRLGICLDSCHLWVSGYDVTDAAQVERLVAAVDDEIGLDRLRVLHVNDAAAPLGSNRDRHANVGEGLLGEALGVFLAQPAFQGLPALLEVPGTDGHGPDADQVRKLRELHARATAAPARRRNPARKRASTGARAGK
ncbi:MAG TPA: deoxyribonuclease IV [Gaiellaceae bacterium]|nr:deoxyribonuclease IV [Gaiellaceae bacterium]